MAARRVLHLIIAISRFGLAALFLFTAGAKLWILKKFASNVAELLSSASINYQRWQWPATIGVITAEIIAAILLIIPRTVRLGAVFAALLLLRFRIVSNLNNPHRSGRAACPRSLIQDLSYRRLMRAISFLVFSIRSP